MAAFALSSAVLALLHDGRPITPGLAMVYTALAAAGCFAIYAYTVRAAKKVESPTLSLNADTWLLDGSISLGAGLAFSIAYFIQGTGWEPALPYIVPALVTVMVLVVIRVPLITLRDNFKEVLGMGPAPDIAKLARQSLERILEDLPIRGIRIRMIRTGRYYYLMIHLIVDDELIGKGIGVLDQIRCIIARGLGELHPKVVSDVIFTADPRWAESLDYSWCAKSGPAESLASSKGSSPTEPGS